MHIIALIACSHDKLLHAAPACLLYTGALFQAARHYAEAHAWPWLVLSARHGLVRPEQVVSPYDLSLSHQRQAARAAWASAVFAQIQETADFPPAPATVVMLAGHVYTYFLAEHLAAAGYTIQRPLQGKSYGRAVAWLKEHTP